MPSPTVYSLSSTENKLQINDDGLFIYKSSDGRCPSNFITTGTGDAIFCYTIHNIENYMNNYKKFPKTPLEYEPHQERNFVSQNRELEQERIKFRTLNKMLTDKTNPDDQKHIEKTIKNQKIRLKN